MMLLVMSYCRREIDIKASLRVDLALVELGLVPSRTKAQDLIRAGAVTVDGKEVRSVSQVIDPVDYSSLQVRSHSLQRFVSRAGIKLQGAIEHLELSVKGKTVLDLGQSTGGFTDCLIQNGAQRVVGVDVGQKQLAPKLLDFSHEFPARLEIFTGLNVKDLHKSIGFANASEGGFDLVVCDLSFISLTAALDRVPGFMRPSSQLLALVKPQFEVGPKNLNKKGLVKDDGLYGEVKVKISQSVEKLGLKVLDYFPSDITGKDGNREFFIYAAKQFNATKQP